jgi:hypothetical protein
VRRVRARDDAMCDDDDDDDDDDEDPGVDSDHGTYECVRFTDDLI